MYKVPRVHDDIILTAAADVIKQSWYSIHCTCIYVAKGYPKLCNWVVKMSYNVWCHNRLYWASV